MAHVEIQARDGLFRAFALQVDSGAVVSLLRRSAGELLGIDIAAGRPVELGSIGGGGTKAFVHDFTARLDDTITLSIPFAIAPTEDVPNLLGRLGVFDPLQIDFDGTVQETRISAPWLDKGLRRVWDTVLAAEKHIFTRWKDITLPPPACDVARRFVERAAQLLASYVGLMKLHREYPALLFIRSLLEVAVQFEYLLDDPAVRAQRYLDFSHVTRHLKSKRIAENAGGPISTYLASSPLRAQGEKRNRLEYDRVVHQFLRPKSRKPWDSWYCMSIRDLTSAASKIGAKYPWTGEYQLLYALGSDWAHGGPMSTDSRVSTFASVSNGSFFICLMFYSRMLLGVSGEMILEAEHYKLLTELAKGAWH